MVRYRRTADDCRKSEKVGTTSNHLAHAMGSLRTTMAVTEEKQYSDVEQNSKAVPVQNMSAGKPTVGIANGRSRDTAVSRSRSLVHRPSHHGTRKYPKACGLTVWRAQQSKAELMIEVRCNKASRRIAAGSPPF